MNSKNIFLCLLFFAVSGGCAEKVWAAPVLSAHVEADLISEVTSIQPGHSFWLAVRLKMEEGWHTYWKNPGDSGLPPKLTWTLPEGLSVGNVLWPFPRLLDEAQLVTYGFEGTVLLFVEVNVDESVPVGIPKEIGLNAKWLSCREMCVPGMADLSLVLSVENQVPAKDVSVEQEFLEGRAQLPRENASWDIKVRDRGKQLLFLLIPSSDAGALKSAYFFPERNDLIDHAANQELKKTKTGYELAVKKSQVNPGIKEINGVLFSEEGWQGRKEGLIPAITANLILTK